MPGTAVALCRGTCNRLLCPGMCELVLVLGVAGLVVVIGFCGWVTFREPWLIGERRARRRAWAAFSQSLAHSPAMPIEQEVGVAGLAMTQQPILRGESRAAQEAAPIATDRVVVVTLDDLDDELLTSSSGEVHIDISAAPFLGVTAFLLLLRVRRELEAQGRRLMIRGVQDWRRRTFELAGLYELISWDDAQTGAPSAA